MMNDIIEDGIEVSSVMSMKMIDSGYNAYCSLPDDIRKSISEEILSGKSVDYYIGILNTTRLMIGWLMNVMELDDYAGPLSVINARVMYIVRNMSLEDKERFIGELNEH